MRTERENAYNWAHRKSGEIGSQKGVFESTEQFLGAWTSARPSKRCDRNSHSPHPQDVKFQVVKIIDFQSWKLRFQERASQPADSMAQGPAVRSEGLMARRGELQNPGQAEAPSLAEGYQATQMDRGQHQLSSVFWGKKKISWKPPACMVLTSTDPTRA